MQGTETDKTTQPYFLSLVPTQLQRLLQQPAWRSLASAIFYHFARRCPSMAHAPRAGKAASTESSTHLRYDGDGISGDYTKASRLLQGRLDAGDVLPHAQVEILGTTGESVAIGQIGTIVLQSNRCFKATIPIIPSGADSKPTIAGYFDERDRLHLAGRSSRKIISGGENIYPEEVETALYSTEHINDVYVTGLPDDHWGEVVVAFYVPQRLGITPQILKDALEDRLSRYKHPKQWLSVEEIPRNAQGKVDRLSLLHLLPPTVAM